MTRRLDSLRRVAAVQKEIVRVAEWRAAAADKLCRDLADDRTRLQSYVIGEGALGPTLAKAALRSLHAIDKRLADAERLRDAFKAAHATAKQREHVVDKLEAGVAHEVRREAEGRDLAATIDGWLTAHGASLR